MNKAILSGLALLVLPLSAAMAQDGTFEMVPGVMVDPAADALYLMSPGGGVERISISTGSFSWRSDEASKPVAMHKNLLIAQAEQSGIGKQLEIVLLDAQSGRVADTLQVDLPEGVMAGIDDAMGREFAARGVVLGGSPMVTWQQTERYSGGVAPGPNDVLVTNREAAYRIDLQASRLVEIEPAAAVAPEPALPASVLSWSAAGTVAERPAMAGAVIAAAEVVGGQTTSSSQVLLRRWDDSGDSLPELELFSGPHVARLRSADGLHLLVSSRAAPGGAEEYEWSVFSLETGAEVGQLRHRQSHSRFFVSDGTLVLIEAPRGLRVNGQMVLSPRLLHAVVLESGATVWQQPLRDTSFKGQMPP